MPTTPAWGHTPTSAPPYPPVHHTTPPTPLGPFNFTYAPSAGAEPVTLRGVITPLSTPVPLYLANNSGNDALRTFIYADFVQRPAEPVPVCTCVYCPAGQGASVHSVPVFHVDEVQVPQAPPPAAVNVPVGVPSSAAADGHAPTPPSAPRDAPSTTTTGVQTDPVASPFQPKASVLQPPDRPPRRRVVSKTAPAGTVDQTAPSTIVPAHDASDHRKEGAGSTPRHTPKKTRRRREEDIPPLPPLPPLDSVSLPRSRTTPLDLSGGSDNAPPFRDSVTFSPKDKKKAKAESPPTFQDLTWPRARLPPPRVPSIPFPVSLESADEPNTARPPPSQRSPLPDAWTNGGERPSVVPQIRDDTDWRKAMGAPRKGADWADLSSTEVSEDGSFKAPSPRPLRSVKSLRKLAPRRKPTADVLNADFSASMALDDISFDSETGPPHTQASPQAPQLPDTSFDNDFDRSRSTSHGFVMSPRPRDDHFQAFRASTSPRTSAAVDSVALSELARLLSLQEQSMEVTLGIGRNISNTLRDYIAPSSNGDVPTDRPPTAHSEALTPDNHSRPVSASAHARDIAHVPAPSIPSTPTSFEMPIRKETPPQEDTPLADISLQADIIHQYRLPLSQMPLKAGRRQSELLHSCDNIDDHSLSSLSSSASSNVATNSTSQDTARAVQVYTSPRLAIEQASDPIPVDSPTRASDAPSTPVSRASHGPDDSSTPRSPVSPLSIASTPSWALDADEEVTEASPGPLPPLHGSTLSIIIEESEMTPGGTAIHSNPFPLVMRSQSPQSDSGSSESTL